MATKYFNFNSTASGHGATGDWTDALNWWTSSAFTVHAGSIPANGDTVYIEDEVTNGPSSPVTLATLLISQTTSDGILGGTDTYITVTGTITVGTTGFSGEIARDITCSSISFHESSFMAYASGTITGNASFYDDSSAQGSTLDGHAIFHDNSYSWASITGDSICYDSSYVEGTIYGTVTFFDSSSLNNFGTASTDGLFFDSSFMYQSTVLGDAVFHNASHISSGSTGSAVAGSADFFEFSSNAGNVYGPAIFHDSSFNAGILENDAIFHDSSYNDGEIWQSAVFNNGSYNAGPIQYHAVFNHTSFNQGDVWNNGTFNDASYNHTAGIVYCGIFSDTTVNNGTITYDAYFQYPTTTNTGTVGGVTYTFTAPFRVGSEWYVSAPLMNPMLVPLRGIQGDILGTGLL